MDWGSVITFTAIASSSTTKCSARALDMKMSLMSLHTIGDVLVNHTFFNLIGANNEYKFVIPVYLH